MLVIKEVSPVWCVVEGGAGLLEPVLSYPSYVYRKVKEEWGFRKKRCDFTQKVTVKWQNGEVGFHSGFLARVKKFLIEREIPHRFQLRDKPSWYRQSPDRIFSSDEIVRIDQKLREHDIVLRDDQRDLMKTLITRGRGVIEAPTGAGKTIVYSATMLHIPRDIRVLVVASDTGLVTQGAKSIQRFFDEPIGVISGNTVKPQRITIGNIQKLHRMPPETFTNIEAVIVDECHHVGSFKGTYATVLEACDRAWLRLAVTGTLPYTEEGKMALEGLVGPVVGVVEDDLLVKQGVLAKPIFQIYKTPFNRHVRDLNTFKEVYAEGIVNNRIRNRMILKKAKEFKDMGLTSLILVKQLEHGENLERMAEVMFPDLRAVYIAGKTNKTVREEIRVSLDEKQFDVVIATVIWKEGIDIPSLGAVINAAGGKFEIFPVQVVGRGRRTTEEKDTVYVVDFFDPSHPYLIDHFGNRFCLYMDKGWI